MDKSETYIKMCRKATEIQDGWVPEVGDWFLHDYQGTTGFGGHEEEIWDPDEFIQFECLTYKPYDRDYIIISREGASESKVYTSSGLLKDTHVWLPRQDQLQDMVINDPYKGLLNMQFFFADFFYDVVTDEDGMPQDSQKFTSLEQIWLAFVMLDKHSKEWDGEEWLVANKDS